MREMKKKKVDNYDFDLILPVEVFKENQERILKENLKRKKKARLNSILWGLLACLVLVGIFYLGTMFQADSMAKCTQKHAYDYCLVKLG